MAAFDVMRDPHHRRFGDFGATPAPIRSGGPQTVSGDVQDVIHPAGDPVIAIFITTRAVAAKVHIFESGEVGLLKALMVAEQGTRCRAESAMARLPSVAPSSGRPSLSTSTGWTPKNGRVAEPAFSSIAPGSGVIIKPPVSVCHRVHHRALRYRSSSSTTPGFRVNRFADRAKNAQRGAVCAFDSFVAFRHQGANSRRGGIENADLMLIDDGTCAPA